MIKRPVSPHELATLFLLMHSPKQVPLGSGDLAALQQQELAEVVTAGDLAGARLTQAGAAVLRNLGMA